MSRNYLGGLAEDLASYGIDDFVLAEQRVVRRNMNWKLVSDTFWEAYHIKVLHKSNIAPMFVKNLALYDGFGLSHRLVGIRNSIEKLRDLPEAKWDLIPHATILMNLFPNTICVMQSDHLETYRVFPVPVQRQRIDHRDKRARAARRCGESEMEKGDGFAGRRGRAGFRDRRADSAQLRIRRAARGGVRAL